MAESINQLDPFKEDESGFKTKEIRHSHSRSYGNPFIWLINPKDEEAKKKRTILLIVLLSLVIVISATFIILNSKSASESSSCSKENPLVNPTGREATSEYTTNLDDPELRESEHEKLATTISLVSKSDWNYARALFETIFPEYLDACDKYDYFRIALLLDDNLEGFEINRERATERMQTHLNSCNRSEE